MSSATELAVALPTRLWTPIVIMLLYPAVFWIGWRLFGEPRRPTISAQFAARAATLVATSLGVLSSFAVLAAIRFGVEATLPTARELALSQVSRINAELGNSVDTVQARAPLRAILAADPRVDAALLVRYPCRTSCLLLSVGEPRSASAERIASQAAQIPAERATLVGGLNGHTVIAGRVPLRDATGTPTALLLLATFADQAINRAIQLAWLLLLVSVLLATLAGAYTATSVERSYSARVQLLIDQMGDPGADVNIAGHKDELHRLTGKVTQLVERSVALETQLQQTQKMEAVGRLTGGIAHDFNNLLTVIRANAALLHDREPSEEVDEIERATQRGTGLVRRLLAFGRQRALDARPESLAPLLHETIATLRRILPETVSVVAPAAIPDLTIETDRGAFDQILLNLVTNARDAMSRGGTLEFGVELGRPSREFLTANRLGTDELVALTIRDTGTGMTPDIAARAFEPFFTTKAPEKGSGLGLSIVYTLMHRQGGAVQINSSPGRGTTVILWFRRGSAAATETPAPTPRPPSSPPRRHRILLVEDDDPVRRVTEAALTRLGFSVVSAGNGREALDLMTTSAPIDAVVSDVQMPVMGGIELLRRIRAKGDSTPVLLISGYSLEDVRELVSPESRSASLGKPWSAAELSAALDQLLTPATAA